jgi:hypothetical protein
VLLSVSMGGCADTHKGVLNGWCGARCSLTHTLRVGEESRHNELDASSRASLAHNVTLRAANEHVRKGVLRATQLRNNPYESTLSHTHTVFALKFEVQKKPGSSIQKQKRGS